MPHSLLWDCAERSWLRGPASGKPASLGQTKRRILLLRFDSSRLHLLQGRHRQRAQHGEDVDRHLGCLLTVGLVLLVLPDRPPVHHVADCLECLHVPADALCASTNRRRFVPAPSSVASSSSSSSSALSERRSRIPRGLPARLPETPFGNGRPRGLPFAGLLLI